LKIYKVVYTIQSIAKLLKLEIPAFPAYPIEQLLIDSRKAYTPATSLFFALSSARRNGHAYIGDLYQKGVRCFVITQPVEEAAYPQAVFLKVADATQALQQLAAAHRAQFSIPVIGITGSNGKTIVKEWLFQLLQTDFKIVRSPKSYNSQIGVPLSVWQLKPYHQLAIFEAGISQPGEMARLQKIIQPTIGVLTSLGPAHNEGFVSMEEKENEKRLLFSAALVPPALQLVGTASSNGCTTLQATGNLLPAGGSITIPFTDAASIQNALRCWEVLLQLQIPLPVIQERMQRLMPVDMRLHLLKGVNGCQLINDAYSADIDSLEIALSFLQQQGGSLTRTVILSDFLESGENDADLYTRIRQLLTQTGVQQLITIGSRIGKAFANPVGPWRLEQFERTEQFIAAFRPQQFQQAIILLKGARSFALERIIPLLEDKIHGTRLEIDLAAVVANLNQYRQQLPGGTRLMAMVKAFAYGSGATEIAHVLQYQGVDYFGVAYADEGVALRQAGITTPIMVMNTEAPAFDAMVEYQLEPVLFCMSLLRSFDVYLQQQGIQGYPIHLELETGMHRLGFAQAEIPSLISYLSATPSFTIRTVFSHLAASEDPTADSFTAQQFSLFQAGTHFIEQGLSISTLKHIANSAAAIRHPAYTLDMVRIGIGLYGVESPNSFSLQPALTLRSTLAQIKKVPKGSSISYNRKTILQHDAIIGTVRLGYADGYPRQLGNGVGRVLVNGQLVPIVGSICMDMFMIDLTTVAAVAEGDEVILFGKELPVQQVASWAQTIPYEILTGISQRVKRVYFQE
jgi:alanine racemase